MHGENSRRGPLRSNRRRHQPAEQVPASGTRYAHFAHLICRKAMRARALGMRQARRAQAAQNGMVHHAAQRPHAARGGSDLKNHRTGLRGKGMA